MNNNSEKVKYGLKIATDFTKEEIINHTHVINVDKKEKLILKEENFENNFLSHTIINLNVDGAGVEFVGRYKVKDSLCDVSCIVNHNADNTKSSINIRGIAETGGKIISRSDICVKENVKGVDGEEKIRFLFIIDENEKTGEIDAIPNLDINSHEVKVSHAMSISKIKKADIWYAGLHGFSEKESEDNFKENFLK